MNYPEFITALEEVYGAYNSDILKKMTAMYIKERWKESELEGVFKKLILLKTAKYKTSISPADFEEIFPRESLEAAANKWYTDLSNTGSSLDNVIISDIRAQKAIQSFGGWTDFCSRNPDYEGLHRKNFVEAFIKFSKEPPEQPKILYGDSSRKMNKVPLMFGDKEQCKQIVELSQRITDQVMQIADNITKDMRV